MDLEKAMEFMLEQQAQMQAQQAQFQAQSEAWQVQFQEGLAEHDKRLAQAERLLVRGAKMLVIQRKAGRETDRRLDELREATLQTQASLKAFIDSMRKPTNGN